jgi:lipid II:glycine glycyltransferase (peptidoglycan interpeptide bridge formation enzyme)
MSISWDPDKYTYEVDTVNQAEWDSLFRCFDDANLYQTWSYGAIHWRRNELSHIILNNNDKIVSITQVAIIKLPLLKMRIAYVFHGPLWQLKDKEKNDDIFRAMLNALKEEYVVKRHYFLRIVLKEYNHKSDELLRKIITIGYRKNNILRPQRSLLIDAPTQVEELWKSLDKKTRWMISKSQKDSSLNVIVGTGIRLYDDFLKVYEEMHSLKKFEEYVDIDEFRRIQQDLPDDMKMVIIVGYKNNWPVSAMINSLNGSYVLYHLGATNLIGRKNNCGYLTMWQLVEYMIEMQKRWIDLGGIDPKHNIGVYHYKKEFGRKDVYSLGEFDVSPNVFASILITFFDIYKRYLRKPMKTIALFNRGK